MPELPEIETIKNSLLPQIVGRQVKSFVQRRQGLRHPFPNLDHLIGDEILSVSRRSKYLLINFAKGDLIIHLGMSGVISLIKDNAPVQKHDHWDMVLDNGWVIRLKDHRRFGAILWQDKNITHPSLANLGPEPLTSQFTANFLFNKTRNKKAAIKSVIMDAHIVVGVGNIYASEALFLSKIHPLTPAKDLDKEQCKNLVSNIKKVLKKGIEAGGATFKDYRKVDGSKGNFISFMKVYARDGEECVNCSSKIQSKVIGGRNSFFCPQCQKLEEN